MIVEWNDDKPHRCPECHSVLKVGSKRMRSWFVHECFHCGCRFTRWPFLRWLLPRRTADCGCAEKLRAVFADTEDSE